MAKLAELMPRQQGKRSDLTSGMECRKLLQESTLKKYRKVGDNAEVIDDYYPEACDSKLGELLLEVPREKGGRPKETGNNDVTSLQAAYEELGINKMTAQRWQTVARLEVPREKPGPRGKEIGPGEGAQLQAVYAELGIGKNTAQRWQTLAKLDETAK